MVCSKCPDYYWCSSQEMDKLKCPVKEGEYEEEQSSNATVPG